MVIQTISQLMLLMVLYMSITFIVARKIKNNNILDVAWGLGFIMTALFTLTKMGLYLPLQLLVTTMVIIWGIRIATFLFIRNYGKPEDIRYQQLAANWGTKTVIYSFLFFFLTQGALILLISAPVIFINSSSTSIISGITLIGMFLWLLGILFETVGDLQLYFFLKNPNNRGFIMQSGLWRYTRHPNYFGEITLWWGIWLMAVELPYGWISILGPITISYIIIFLSGIPMAEKQLSLIPGFKEYTLKTSILIPWLPKK